MTTEWMKKHINPELLLRYEQVLNELRGRTSSLDRVVWDIKHCQALLEEQQSPDQNNSADP